MEIGKYLLPFLKQPSAVFLTVLYLLFDLEHFCLYIYTRIFICGKYIPTYLCLLNDLSIYININFPTFKIFEKFIFNPMLETVACFALFYPIVNTIPNCCS